MKKFKGRKPGSTTVKDDERLAIVIEIKEGKTPEEIAKKHERSVATVEHIGRKAGYGLQAGRFVHRVEKKVGAGGKGRKEVALGEMSAVVADYKKGALVKDIATKYKRNPSTIYSIIEKSGVTMRGKGWANGASSVLKAKASRAMKKAKVLKKSKTARVAAMVNHASEALRRAEVTTSRPDGEARDTIKRAVVVLMKTLEHEGVQQLFVDFDKRRFQIVRTTMEERGI